MSGGLGVAVGMGEGVSEGVGDEVIRGGGDGVAEGRMGMVAGTAVSATETNSTDSAGCEAQAVTQAVNMTSTTLPLINRHRFVTIPKIPSR
jgi:hypothetical protein